MAKVSIVRCGDYQTKNVYDAVKRAVDLIGGMAEFVKPGMKVLVKPNLLSPRLPEDAVDTHPEVVRAVVRLVKEAQGTPIIGDSPGGYGDNMDEVFEKSGMRALSKEENVELVKFTMSKFIDGIPISRHVFECDRFISVPKLKTHCLTVLTAAIKNTYGTVPGIHKAECHSKAPKGEDFAKVIAKVFSLARPHLTILDGIVAMEGDGPSSGTARPMGLVMAGADAVAVDSCVAHLVGLKPLDIVVTQEAYRLGLGEAEMSRIEVVGDDMAAFVQKDFKLPQTLPFKFLPRSLVMSVASLVRFRPSIDRSVCTGCNLCKTSCPVDAITSNGNYCKINYTKCIKCLCCHEVCPYKAVEIKRNIVAKMIWG